MSIEDKAEEIQQNLERRFSSIGKGKYARILRMARKPTRDEYIKVLVITAVGLLIIGGRWFHNIPAYGCLFQDTLRWNPWKTARNMNGYRLTFQTA
ncbi:SecE/sec61-gamma family protein translocase subunit [Thermoplasma acidophilum]|uniref:SecE/sec61-gamma family protein translocase subunit n=1 Tax=Thermoplasma acidophilum TaxID=2303 RepID=UPI001F523C29|nr:SecE/sec61-gamma family protein translocase subunit [Thermoplasma acidophilum]